MSETSEEIYLFIIIIIYFFVIYTGLSSKNQEEAIPFLVPNLRMSTDLLF